MRPADIVDREFEWTSLEDFATSKAPGLRVGLLYGRRRTGKSFLLRRLVRAVGGLYHMALEEEPYPALQRFAEHVADEVGVPAGALRFSDWEQALRTATGISASGTRGGVPLLVIDELPYLLSHPPGTSIPSVLQMLVDESRDNPGPPRRVIICGSALAVMSELLSGTKALRGRAELDLQLRSFEYRTAAEFYGVDDPETAFQLHAVLGGTPGYRDLLPFIPTRPEEIEQLVTATLLNPSHALFGEAAYLLREDPRVTDRALYHSVLTAIAGGARTPTAVGGVLGRDQRSLSHVLDVLTSSGFVVRDDDLLLQRRPRLRLADPVIAFHQLITEPRLATFEDRRTQDGWRDAAAGYESALLGPHFEQLARDWVRLYAGPDILGGTVGEVGSTVVNDQRGRAQHELDVVALAAGARRQANNPLIRVLGEAKATTTLRGPGDLARLERIRDVLAERGAQVQQARLLLFSRRGFVPELIELARNRSDVELVDLQRMYGP